MRYRLFGSTGLRVSELFLGTMNFGSGVKPPDCARILDAYADAGGNFIDTSVNYSGGRSEQIVGRLIRRKRSRFVLSTKYTVSRDGGDPNAAGNHRKNLRTSLDLSLRRLATDHIDVYWVHVWDRHTPVEETMRALDDAVHAGKISYVGISDAPAWIVARANTLAEWRGWMPFAGLQVPFNLLNREVETELLPMAEAFGMTVAAWSPLARGVLTGKDVDDEPGGIGNPSGEGLVERARKVVTAVGEIADELGVTRAVVALAWAMARSRAIHPIVGARTPEQLIDNLAAVECVLPAGCQVGLDEVSGYRPTFPVDFIDRVSPRVFGRAGALLDGR